MNKYPRGMLKGDDEGAIAIAIGTQDKTVIINFGKPIAWIGFSSIEARQIAQTLINHANNIEGTKK